MASDEGTHRGDLVVACTLGSSDLAAQARRWSDLRRRAEVRQETTAGGKRLHFRADEGVADELRELCAIESGCCSWATWTVEDDEDGPVLEVTSTGYGVDVIHQMLGRLR